MKTFIAILLLGCVYANKTTEEATKVRIRVPEHRPVAIVNNDEKKIEELLKSNGEKLDEAAKLLRHFDTINDQIKANLEQQRKALNSISNIEELLAKQNVFIDAQSEALLEAFANNTKKCELSGGRTLKELRNLTRLQEDTKYQLISLELNLGRYQKHVTTSARNIDNSILALSKLITRAVLPKLNTLECSLGSFETSQINIELELKSLGRIKTITEDSNAKLVVLEQQLRHLNRTQERRIDGLTAGVKKLVPLNSWQIEHSLRELLHSQQRIEYNLENCDKHKAHPRHRNPLSEKPHYEPSPQLPGHRRPRPLPTEPNFDLSPIYKPKPRCENPVTYYTWDELTQPKPRPHKPGHYSDGELPQYKHEPNFDWSPVYKPKPRGESSDTSYNWDELIKPKPRPHKPGHYYDGERPHHKHEHEISTHSVSWQEPLPWDTLSLCQSGSNSKNCAKWFASLGEQGSPSNERGPGPTYEWEPKHERGSSHEKSSSPNHRRPVYEWASAHEQGSSHEKGPAYEWPVSHERESESVGKKIARKCHHNHGLLCPKTREDPGPRAIVKIWEKIRPQAQLE